jgi:hypothetical protein
MFPRLCAIAPVPLTAENAGSSCAVSFTASRELARRSCHMARTLRVVLAAGLVCMATNVHASSPEAWAELYAKSGEACLKAADLNGAKLRGQPVDFQGVVLLVVDGNYPQPHMKNARGTKYCLYDKKSGKTEVAEAALVSPAKAAGKSKEEPATGRTCWSESFRAQLKTPIALGRPCRAKNDEGDVYQGIVRR